MDKPITVDFETESIEDRPHYPPKPVGVSIKLWGRAPKYYAWGHPEGNNCTKRDAELVLKRVWQDKLPKLFQNEKFDQEVAEKHFGLPLLPWDKAHDTMFLLFLKDPHSKTLSLKPSAERYLDMPPEEQDLVKEWVLANVPGVKPSEWGAHICKAPAHIVGPYANGDVVRTEKLYALLYPQIVADGMLEAYNRERRLMPILLRNEQVGIRVDVAKLDDDLHNKKTGFHASVQKAEQWIFKRLGREFNIDSDAEKVDALDAAGVVTDWKLTPTGRRSTSKKNLTVDMFNDPKVASVIGYRDRLCTCIRMFGENWLEMAASGDGHVHTHWNQVAQGDEQGKKVGTRTGRPSTSNPNFLNVSKTWYDKDDGYVHPKFLKVPELPLMRSYLLPDKGCLWLHRDYSQQELRVAAHFAGGKMAELFNTPVAQLPPEYLKDGRLDIHNYVSLEVKRLRHLDLPRRPTKITVFRKIYGGGVGSTMEALRVDFGTAKRILAAIAAALPGLEDLDKELKKIGRAGDAIRTWGGRLYYCEPAAYSEKYRRHMTFEYKLLNYEVQGSSSDATKEAQIRYDDIKKDGRFLVAVYDESNASAAIKAAKAEMKLMRQAMESVEFDVPMLTDGKIGPNWGALEAYKD